MSAYYAAILVEGQWVHTSFALSRRPILANGTAQWTIYDGAAPSPLPFPPSRKNEVRA